MCVYFYIISVLVWLILVHQVKLDLNEKCCQGDLIKLINGMFFYNFLLINEFFVSFLWRGGIFLVKSVSIVILKLYNNNNN